MKNFTMLGAALLLMVGGALIGWNLRSTWERDTLNACAEHSAVCDTTLERSFAQTREAIKTGHECLSILKRLHPEMKTP